MNERLHEADCFLSSGWCARGRAFNAQGGRGAGGSGVRGGGAARRKRQRGGVTKHSLVLRILATRRRARPGSVSLEPKVDAGVK